MKAIQAHPQQGLDGLTPVDLLDPGDPGPSAIRVRVHATSLNFHDLTGRLPAADGRIPMGDGAGVVEAVGSEVTGFRPGDHVVSTFFPTWLDGEAMRARLQVYAALSAFHHRENGVAAQEPSAIEQIPA